ncbi:MAG: replication initiator protein A [Clostridiales bacterium]|nr:replication initiator protein A [Clostridiales bacterium]
MTKYMTADTQLPPYMVFPRFLMDIPLPETAKLLYVLLLDRARLSLKSGGWTDSRGRVFIYFTIHGMAEALHKSEMTAKNSLSRLEDAGLIARRRQGQGKPNRIYVKIPADTAGLTDNKMLPGQTGNCLPDRQETVSMTAKKLSGNKKEGIKIIQKNRGSNMPHAYGSCRNVFLTDAEFDALKADVPGFGDYIERLSVYMASTGKTYKNHAATIRSWELRDRAASPKRNYECREDESL